MKYVELGFRSISDSPVEELPPFLGPTLRGALGYLLKKTACQMAHGRCDGCLLSAVCPYPAIFEGRPDPHRLVMRLYPRIPQPFVLLVPRPDEQWGTSGELVWGIRLFGDACRYWPYIVHAYQVAGEQGLGQRRVRYNLAQVRDGLTGPPIWSSGASSDRTPTLRSVDDHAKGVNLSGSRCALRWQFHTPVRLRDQGRLSMNGITPLNLVLAGRRRYGIFQHFYDNTHSATSEGYPHLEQDSFRIVESRLAPWGLTRFSTRQQQRMRLDGLIGELIIEGPWSNVGPWLGAVQLLHLGKATTFGFGRVQWSAA